MKVKPVILTTLALLLLLPVISAFAQDAPDRIRLQVITTFSYPGNGTSTIPEGINDRGDITGLYTDANGITRGFIRFKSGNFSPPIVEPNDTGNLTEGRGINHQRVVAGFYAHSDGTFHGYFRDQGVFTEYDVPGASNTYVEGINDTADFVGADDSNGVLLAFRNINGNYETIDIPNATTSYAFGINHQLTATGQYTDNFGVIRGYFADADGNVTSFSPPGASQTLPFGISNRGYIVGRYTGSDGIEHGFLFKPTTASFLTFDGPGAVFTSLNGMNTDGFICGRFDDGSGVLQGILLQAVPGQPQ